MHTHGLQDSLFRKKKKKEGGEEEKKNQRLTDPRAGVRFRFNVSLHVRRGLWEWAAGEELGLVWKGVGLAGGPHGCHLFCAYEAP